MAKRKRKNPFRVAPAPSGAGFEDTPENRQRIKDLGFGSLLDDAPASKPQKRGFFGGAKPRPRSRVGRFGGSGSPSKRTRGGSMNRLRKKQDDYVSRLPRPTMGGSQVTEQRVTPDPVVPTRPTPPEEPRGRRQTQIKPNQTPPDMSDIPLQDPFTVKPSPVNIPDATDAVGFPEVDFDREVTKEFIPSGGMEIQVPKQQMQVGALPKFSTGSSFFPMVTPEDQPETLPAPAGTRVPVVKQPFVDPFNLQRTPDPMEVPAFGIRKEDGTFFSPEETKSFIENYTMEQLREMFGDALVTNILKG